MTVALSFGRRRRGPSSSGLPRKYGAGASARCYCKLTRGHSKEVYHLEWFKDQKYIVSGSHDYSVIVWDVKKARLHQRFDGPINYVKAVGVDPLGKYFVAQSCDRTLRVFKRNKQKKTAFFIKSCISKVALPNQVNELGEPIEQKLFLHESSIENFFRRLDWSPDGSMFIVPGGEYLDTESSRTIFCAYLFSKQNLMVPCLAIPSDKPIILVKFCSAQFEIAANETSLFDIPTKMIYVLGSYETLSIYSTASTVPLYVISGIHYASFTDFAWYQHQYLLVSSMDGFVTFVAFEHNEFGRVIEKKG